MLLNDASKKMRHSATLTMNETVKQLRKSGKEVFHLGFGESPFPTHPYIRKALCDNAHQRSYLPTQGILPLREQVSAFYESNYNLHVSPDQVVVGPGSKILLFDAMMALQGPLFVPTPSWVSYDDQARLLGKEVHYIKTDYESSYLLAAEGFEDALLKHHSSTEDQKLLVINYPNNPTGQSYSKSQLKELADVARRYNVVILSDEIYALLSYQNHEHHSIAEFYPEGTLVTGGLSKDRAAGGFRVGVIILPAEEPGLLESMRTIASNTWSCLAAPMQYAAIEAYRPNPEISNYIKDSTTVCEIVTKYIHRRLQSLDIRCLPPKGAFYLFPDWNADRDKLASKGIKTSTDISDRLLQDWSVATLPGSDFGMAPSELCVRIATVDYDGKFALDQYKRDSKMVLSQPDLFVTKVAPHLIESMEILEKFTKSFR
ncbi:aminotransferase class I/II-fold pyridoxal phosphate-dependent enzyme [Candidatus Thorarchaeota archaeon]|nr:MAG: aminotransferase class I/II-fold pyridoxal phosphate-dependent enzyme [Candidatus Thorarchaeota archaeon]